MQTIASHELALYEINNGKRYEQRCRATNYPQNLRASAFAQFARDAAREYEREFGAPDDRGMIYTAEDILLAAIELAEYYTQHVKERDCA